MYKIGHLQYKVKNLAQAMEAFKQLGFEIERGGEKSKMHLFGSMRVPILNL